MCGKLGVNGCSSAVAIDLGETIGVSYIIAFSPEFISVGESEPRSGPNGRLEYYETIRKSVIESTSVRSGRR